MPDQKPEFKFVIPERRDVSEIGNLLLQLGAIAGRLALEPRTQVDHKDGRAENVAEHTHMLSRLAPVVAIVFYPDLSPGLVAMLAEIHDDIEAYVGDIPTMHLDENIVKTKEMLEKVGLEKLLADFSHIPAYTNLVIEYAEQKTPESRFVRVLDKLMPLVVHFNQGGETLRDNWTPASMLQNNEQRAQSLKIEYPEFADLIDVRTELTELAARELF
ncbi:MAG: HD domain-containing protein [Patescibacteria group bacterium]|mgnify:CR=1 FL=1